MVRQEPDLHENSVRQDLQPSVGGLPRVNVGHYVIGDDGEDIRWESIDADMHISSFLETSEPKDNEIGALFAKYPWLNISEVARSLNINKSLLARYIYGISKPSEKRVTEIKEALHRFGKELLSA